MSPRFVGPDPRLSISERPPEQKPGDPEKPAQPEQSDRVQVEEVCVVRPVPPRETDPGVEMRTVPGKRLLQGLVERMRPDSLPGVGFQPHESRAHEPVEGIDGVGVLDQHNLDGGKGRSPRSYTPARFSRTTCGAGSDIGRTATPNPRVRSSRRDSRYPATPRSSRRRPRPRTPARTGVARPHGVKDQKQQPDHREITQDVVPAQRIHRAAAPRYGTSATRYP